MVLPCRRMEVCWEDCTGSACAAREVSRGWVCAGCKPAPMRSGEVRGALGRACPQLAVTLPSTRFGIFAQRPLFGSSGVILKARAQGRGCLWTGVSRNSRVCLLSPRAHAALPSPWRKLICSPRLLFPLEELPGSEAGAVGTTPLWVSRDEAGAVRLLHISRACRRRCTSLRSPESSGAALSFAQMEDAYVHLCKQ